MDVFLCFTLITIHNNKRKLKITYVYSDGQKEQLGEGSL